LVQTAFCVLTPLYVLIPILAALAVLLCRKGKITTAQGISVIVAARNEEHNLPVLLSSLAKLDYPPEAYELIIVSDHSTDASVDILRQWQNRLNLKVIDWQEEEEGIIGKKAALLQGIRAAKHELLAFTDADCEVPSTWLRAFSQAFENDVDYVLGYSLIKRDKQDGYFRLKNFERGIYYSLAALGMRARHPITSSACNMAYRKSAFLASKGFEGIGHLASGDDDLLLMKMMPRLRRAVYNPSPAQRVVSYEGHDLSKRHHTNVRRASKFRYFPLWLQLMGVFVFLYFILFYLSIAALALGSSNPWLPLMFMIKTGTELSLGFIHFFRTGLPWLGALYPVQLLWFPGQFVYYSLRGSLGKYRWK